MAFLLFVAAAWVSLCILWAIPKALPLADNLSLYFINSLVVICTFTIITLNLHIMESTRNPELFLAFLCFRSIVIQALLIIFSNLQLRLSGGIRRWSLACLALAVLLLIEAAAKGFHLIEYKRWNFACSFLMYAVFLLASYGAAHGLLMLERRRRHADHPLR